MSGTSFSSSVLNGSRFKDSKKSSPEGSSLWTSPEGIAVEEDKLLPLPYTFNVEFIRKRLLWNFAFELSALEFLDVNKLGKSESFSSKFCILSKISSSTPPHGELSSNFSTSTLSPLFLLSRELTLLRGILS